MTPETHDTLDGWTLATPDQLKSPRKKKPRREIVHIVGYDYKDEELEGLSALYEKQLRRPRRRK